MQLSLDSNALIKSIQAHHPLVSGHIQDMPFQETNIISLHVLMDIHVWFHAVKDPFSMKQLSLAKNFKINKFHTFLLHPISILFLTFPFFKLDFFKWNKNRYRPPLIPPLINNRRPNLCVMSLYLIWNSNFFRCIFLKWLKIEFRRSSNSFQLVLNKRKFRYNFNSCSTTVTTMSNKHFSNWDCSKNTCL